MGILSALFGGSSSKATSENKAYPYLKDALAPAISGGVANMNALNENLAGGFDQYKKNAGFNFALGEGLSGLTGAAAAGGLLRSGSNAKGIGKYVTGLQGQYYDNFLNKLRDASTLGLGAAGTVAGAGATSTSSGKSQNGILTSLFG